MAKAIGNATTRKEPKKEISSVQRMINNAEGRDNQFQISSHCQCKACCLQTYRCNNHKPEDTQADLKKEYEAFNKTMVSHQTQLQDLLDEGFLQSPNQ